MIHVFFSPSAAGTFRKMLRARGIAEEVAEFFEELDFGPISHGALAEREPWLNQYAPLYHGDHNWIGRSEARFRQRIDATSERLIWIAPSSATEQTGLYWYLSQFAGADFKLAVADYPFDETWNGKAPLMLDQLDVEPMARLYDGCPRVQWDPVCFPETKWSALVADNALIRVVVNGRLQSGADDYFDGYLLARCPLAGAKWPRVVAEAMGDIWNAGQSAGSALLLWRLRTLIENDRIICDGQLPLFGGGVFEAAKIRRAG
jgi:Protein of unknown function/Domain of unknown function (DUF1835)